MRARDLTSADRAVSSTVWVAQRGTIRIEWEAQEDGAALTSFVVDDVAIVVEGT